MSAAELKDYGYLVSADGSTTIAAGSLSATVYCKTWWQDQHGLYYVNWKGKHVGKFCYNGNDVWIGARRGGYHRCDQGYGILYDIEVKNCVENKIYVNTRPGYGFENWDYYRVHVIWCGIPLYASHDMHANVYPSGHVYFY